MYFPEKTSENVVSTVQGGFQQLPPREGDREAVVGVAEVGNIYKFECICEGTSSQDAILQSGLSYLRHYRPAVGISDL